MTKLVPLVLVMAFASAAYAAPMHYAGQQMSPVNSLSSPHTYAAPVPFFRAPDPGIPADNGNAALNAASASNAQRGLIQNLNSNEFNTSSGALVPTDLTPHRGSQTLGRLSMMSLQIPPSAPINVSTHLSLEPGTNRVASGNFLVKPSDDCVVQTSFGSIKIAARSCVLIASTPHALTVYDMHDRHAGSVVWENGKSKMRLLPGWQVTVTDQLQAPLGQINPCAAIQLQSLQSEPAPDGLRLFLANFSIASALSLIEPLRHDSTVIKAAAIQRMTGP